MHTKQRFQNQNFPFPSNALVFRSTSFSTRAIITGIIIKKTYSPRSPVLSQVSPERDLGEDPATSFQVELAERQTLAGRVDQARERAHPDEGERGPIFPGRGGQQQRPRRHPAEDQAASADQSASV